MDKEKERKPIRSFRDLDVYQITYRAMLIVMKQIVPNLPDSEKYDLKTNFLVQLKLSQDLLRKDMQKDIKRQDFGNT
jgi:hypothetical protein